jgi:asparagine synthase (glutamine-hydrolysing)
MGVIVAVLPKSVPVDPDLVRAMLAASPHRRGTPSIAVCGNCGLGALNLTDEGDAELSSAGEWMGAFSGRLDNKADVVRILAGLGHSVATSRDADLIVALFKALGNDAPSKLRGSFAAAVTNGNELWCFRDQLGWRPIHYRDDATRFVAASEARQVIAGATIPREPDLAVLETMFYSRLTRSTPSVIKGVERLPQATILHVTRGDRPVQQRYWRPSELMETSGFPLNEVAERFNAVFETAVARCLTGKDVISLSGGIDSPAVAGFAAPLFKRMTNRPLAALSTVYPDYPRVDESGYIQLVASYLGMELHTFSPKTGPWDDLPRWNDLLDGPVPTLAFDEVAEYNGLARQLGFRNVIGGDIAEVVFNLNRHVIGHLVTRGRWKALLEMWPRVHAQGTSALDFGKYMIAPFIPGRLANWHLHRTGRDFPQRIPDWLSPAKVNEVPFRSDLLRPARDRYTGVQLFAFEGTSLTLEAGDVAAEMTGVTSRSPFGDVDLIEFFISLPAEVKFPDLASKTLMRRMLRGRLPDAILDRKDKTTFSDYIMSHLNYDAAAKYLTNPKTHIPGVDYARLAERIERRDFKLIDYAWANDLLRIHIFLSEW